MSDSAFPQIESKSDSPAGYYVTDVFSAGSLTRRELFAAMVMQGLISRETQPETYEHPDKDRKFTRAEIIANWAISYADALIAELGKTNE